MQELKVPMTIVNKNKQNLREDKIILASDNDIELLKKLKGLDKEEFLQEVIDKHEERSFEYKEKLKIADLIHITIKDFFESRSGKQLLINDSLTICTIYDEDFSEIRRVFYDIVYKKKYMDNVHESLQKKYKYITPDSVNIFKSLDLICININLRKLIK